MQISKRITKFNNSLFLIKNFRNFSLDLTNYHEKFHEIMKNVILNKNGVFYFRLTIPPDLRHPNSCRDIALSLGTRIASEAELLALPLIKYCKDLYIHCRQRKLKIMWQRNSIFKQGDSLLLNLVTSITIDGLNVQLDGTPQEIAEFVSKIKSDKAPVPKEIPAPKIETSPLLSIAVNNFLKHLESLNYAPRSILSYISALNELLWILGKDSRVSDLTERNLKNFIKTSFALPTGKKYDKNKTVEEVLHLGLPARSYKTSALSYSHISVFIRWLRKNELLNDDPLKNVFLPDKKRSLENFSYANFTKEDLSKILGKDLLVLSHNFAYRYWMIVLGLYTGARRNELSQLLLKNVHLDSPVPYIEICINKESKQRVKNRSSIRKIPLHKKILELGFADYVQQIQKESYRDLFPEIVKEGDSITDSTIWFANYCKKLGVYGDEKRSKVFHSFRHTFISELQHCGVPLEVRQSIAGHTAGNITVDVYGEKSHLEKMKEAIDLVDFGIEIPSFKNLPSHARKRKMIILRRKGRT